MVHQPPDANCAVEYVCCVWIWGRELRLTLYENFWNVSDPCLHFYTAKDFLKQQILT